MDFEVANTQTAFASRSRLSIRWNGCSPGTIPPVGEGSEEYQGSTVPEKTSATSSPRALASALSAFVWEIKTRNLGAGSVAADSVTSRSFVMAAS